jgi:hypothetical protein
MSLQNRTRVLTESYEPEPDLGQLSFDFGPAPTPWCVCAHDIHEHQELPDGSAGECLGGTTEYDPELAEKSWEPCGCVEFREQERITLVQQKRGDGGVTKW